MMVKDYYVMLQISRSASLADIKAAYKAFALKLHPDVTGGHGEKTEVFKQLTEAYNVLSNEHRRKQYDSSLGISKVPHFYGGTGGGAANDVKAPRPPPGFKVFDHEEWDAWHYGINAEAQSSFTIKNKWMHQGFEGNKGHAYFVRQKTKEAQGGGSVGEQEYRRGRAEKQKIVDRMNERRQKRMAGNAYESESASSSSCTIS